MDLAHPQNSHLYAIPEEIIHDIVLIVSKSGKEDLKALSLSSRKFLDSCRQHLFRSMLLDINPSKYESLDGVMDKHHNSLLVLGDSPHLSCFVRSLWIHSGYIFSRSHKFSDQRVAALKHHLPMITELHDLTVHRLSHDRLIPCVDFTNALRNCLLANPHIHTIIIDDTFHFPMDALSCIPSLEELIISEFRVPTQLISELQKNDARLSFVSSIFPFVHARHYKAPKHLHLPPIIRPSPDSLPFLRKLSLTGKSSETSSIMNVMFDWILEKNPFGNICNLEMLVLTFNVVEDVKSGWNIILLCAKSLRFLLILDLSEHLSTKPPILDLSRLPNLKVFGARGVLSTESVTSCVAWFHRVSATAEPSRFLSGSLTSTFILDGPRTEYTWGSYREYKYHPEHGAVQTRILTRTGS